MSVIKKFWKIGLGVIFVLSGFAGLTSGEFVGAVGCFAIGGGLLFWWHKGRGAVEQSPRDERPAAAPSAGTYNREFNVAGVTYKNDDGTDRQKLLEQIYLKKPPFDKKSEIGLTEYSYNGEPAVAVTVNGQCVGNLHEKDRDALLKAGDRVKGFSEFYVGRFIPEDKPHGGYIYYAKVKVAIAPKK